jgi:hypothetical protein
MIMSEYSIILLIFRSRVPWKKLRILSLNIERGFEVD